jgi:5'-phosphate synthase pdxT subunit
MVIGILALQGAVSLHESKLQSLGVPSRQVKKPLDLENLSGLILPGGESSSMIHLLKLGGLWDKVKDFVAKRPSWGLCAGAILLAKEVKSPQQESFQALNITVVRNAYGRQSESFIANLEPSPDSPIKESFEGVFIRAPRIQKLGSKTKTHFTLNKEPVMVQEGFTLASTFHPELGENLRLHQFFLNLCKESQ